MPKYTDEQKREYVEFLRDSDLSISAAAKHRNVSVSSLSRWNTQLPVLPKYGPLRTAVERTVEALATNIEHAAMVASARALASHIDGSQTFDDKAYREYRLILKQLAEATANGSDDDFDEEIKKLGSLTEMGDTKNT